MAVVSTFIMSRENIFEGEGTTRNLNNCEKKHASGNDDYETNVPTTNCLKFQKFNFPNQIETTLGVGGKLFHFLVKQIDI